MNAYVVTKENATEYQLKDKSLWIRPNQSKDYVRVTNEINKQKNKADILVKYCTSKGRVLEVQNPKIIFKPSRSCKIYENGFVEVTDNYWDKIKNNFSWKTDF